MTFRPLDLPALLDRLEAFHGRQEPCWPTEPYEFLIWWHCGYPASDAACTRGWDALTKSIGIRPAELLAAPPARLAAALKAGGMVPELRAQRVKEIAQRVQHEYGGDLRGALAGPVAGLRKALKRFPGIADPGADRILLFAHLAPVAAVPSNCTHVPARIFAGSDAENYNASYREAQSIIECDLPRQFEARTRAYLLIKHHGQTICKRTNPRCNSCPVNEHCAYPHK